MTEQIKGELEQPELNQTAPELNSREVLESEILLENSKLDEETEVTDAPKIEEVDTAKNTEESNPTDRVKAEMLKRINKVTARAKSAEEELAELRAENERLKKNVEVKTEPSTKREPTMEECEIALEKAFSEGDHKFAAQVTKYMAEMIAKNQRAEAENALREQSTQKTDAEKKQLSDWSNLCQDYEPRDADGKVDIKHPLNLSNQQGLLYTTALDLFKDKELHAKYAGYDPIVGFRLAVNDAYRGILEQGLYKPVVKQKNVVEGVVKTKHVILAEPDASGDDSDSTPSFSSNELSDAEKARSEINFRTKNRYQRVVHKT